MKLNAYQKPHRVMLSWGAACLFAGVLLFAYDVALARYADVLRENDYRTYLGYATSLIEEKNYLNAMEHVDRAKKLAPDNPEPFAVAGAIHLRLKHWKQAIDNLEIAIKNGDTSRGPRMDIVWSNIEMGHFDVAAALGEQYAGEVEDNTPLLQYAAEAYLRGKEAARAIPLLQRALNTSPNNLYLLSRLVSAYHETGDDAAAGEMQARIDAIHGAIGQLGGNEP